MNSSKDVYVLFPQIISFISGNSLPRDSKTNFFSNSLISSSLIFTSGSTDAIAGTSKPKWEYLISFTLAGITILLNNGIS